MHMPELRGRLEDMGIDRANIAHLGRWDLVHLIREMANEALESGVGDEMHM